MNQWRTNIPIYVTREKGDGTIGFFSIEAWMAFLLMYALYINAIIWSVVGVVTAVGLLV